MNIYNFSRCAIIDADIIISLSHFKCHEATGIGGALKNIGMGCGSRAGKMEMHSSGKPYIREEECISCGMCVKNCAHDAISITTSAVIDHDICVGCGRCIGACPQDAVRAAHDEAFNILSKKIVEYSCAVLKGRPHFHVSLVIDVSPFCDCHGENDVPIVPDVGMFASFDPVALDTACSDAVNRQPAIKDSLLDKNGHKHKDHFTDVSPETDWKVAIDYAVEMKLGRKDYELITI